MQKEIKTYKWEVTYGTNKGKPFKKYTKVERSRQR